MNHRTALLLSEKHAQTLLTPSSSTPTGGHTWPSPLRTSKPARSGLRSKQERSNVEMLLEVLCPDNDSASICINFVRFVKPSCNALATFPMEEHDNAFYADLTPCFLSGYFRQNISAVRTTGGRSRTRLSNRLSRCIKIPARS